MAFEKTQNKLDELRNLTWQNGKLVEQIEKLTKMLEEKDDSTLVVEINEAKRVLAAAINTKGGDSTPDESFQQLAEDIQTLPYTGISAEGIVQTEEFNFLKYVTSGLNNEIVSINDSTITKITRTNAFFHNIALREVIMNGVTTISGSSTFQDCSSLQSLNLPNLTTISGSNTFQACSSLQNVQLPNLTTIYGTHTFSSCSSLQNVEFPNLTTISGANCFAHCESTKKVNLPNITIISAGQTFWGCSSLEVITFGTLTTLVEIFRDNLLNLRSITIGQGTNINLQFQKWTATNVIAEGQSGIDELNSNLYNNLLTKLYDHSEDGEERTLRLGWYNYVSEENKLYAKNKGWNITS